MRRFILIGVLSLALLNPGFSNPSDSIDIDTMIACEVGAREDVEYYVIEFWATWCKPCVRAIPYLNEVHRQNENENLRFIAVTNEQIPVIKNFLDHTSIEACIGIDRDFSLMKRYGFNLIPVVVIVNKTGDVFWKGKPFELDTSILNDVSMGREIKEVSDSFFTDFTLRGSSYEEISRISLSTNGSKKIEVHNRSIDAIYSQLLSLREPGEEIELQLKDRPKHGFSYDCTCEVATSQFTDHEFYTYCLEGLNNALNATLEPKYKTIDFYTFYVKDTTKLNKYVSTMDSIAINIDESKISVEHIPLEHFVDGICSSYTIDGTLEEFPIYYDYSKRYDIQIDNVELSRLKTELETIGISFEINSRTKQVYTLEFN